VTVTNTLKLWVGGLVTLSGGNLNVGILDLSVAPINSAISGFHWTGGNLTLLEGSLFGPTSFAIPAGGALSGSGSVFPSLVLNGNLSLLNTYDNLSVHGAISGPGNISLAANTTLTADSINANSLTLAGLVRIRPNGTTSGVSAVTSLTLAGGKMDLSNNQLSVGGTTLGTIRTDLHDGLLYTSASGGALGYADQGGGVIEVKFTLPGDANLDGSVAVGDLGALATNYGVTAGAFWSQGDFNYDGKVDVGDLGALATNYGASLPNIAASAQAVATTTAALASVPEPATLGMLAVGVMTLVCCRRGSVLDHLRNARRPTQSSPVR
jgi:hypothetical protein